MRFLKVLGLLSFLVTSSLVYASANFEELHHQEESSNSPQFHEVIQNVGESILTAISNTFVPYTNAAFSTPDFVFRGSYSARIANDYIRYSATIKPGLDIRKILFPYHTFL